MQDPQVVAEWEKYQRSRNQFTSLLSGKTEKSIENFIEEELHPRFVYFSDYKKIYGNINLNEFRGERWQIL